MNRGRKILIFGGAVLAAFGMSYGLHYALFVEHQTLDQMGGALAGAFVHAAEGKWDESQSALAAYRETKFDYVRQVDVHSHWIGLAMLMVVLGVVFDQVAFGQRTRMWIAVALLSGSWIFPLGVVLQTVNHQAAIWRTLGSAIAVAGSALVIVSLGAAAVGFMRAEAK